jgi:2-iminobutanoate/2-iminopropanoate deaminase
MKKTRNNHPNIAPTTGNYVRSIRVGDMLFISGCTAVNTPAEDADVLTQAKVTLDRIKRIVEAEGGQPSDVVRVVVYVTDMAAFRPLISKFDTLMEEVFKGQYPTSTLVEAPGLARPSLKIEIEATAMF